MFDRKSITISFCLGLALTNCTSSFFSKKNSGQEKDAVVVSSPKVNAKLEVAGEMEGQLAIDSGPTLLTESFKQSLAISSDLVRAGDSINVSSLAHLEDSDVNNLVLAISLETGASLNEENLDDLAVLYHIAKSDGTRRVGFLQGSQLKVVNGVVTFNLVGIGNYQPVYLKGSIGTAKEVETNEKIFNQQESNSQKLAGGDCLDLEPNQVLLNTEYTACDGTKAVGTLSTASGSAMELCKSDGEIDCIANEDFKAVSVSGLKEKVKTGVVVAGVTGNYPSAGNELTGASASVPDLTNAFFNTRMTSAAQFEYFDSSGTKHTRTGETDVTSTNILSGVTILGTLGSLVIPAPDPWDVRYGVAVGAVTGKFKSDCRNMVGAYNNTTAPATGGLDVFDTIDDTNAGTAGLPSSNPFGNGESHLCGFNDPADPNWEMTLGSGVSSIFKDKISGLNWTRGSTQTFYTSANAMSYCDGLSHGGISTWRLPTQKELMAAYNRGIYDLDSDNTATNNLENLNLGFWSSTTLASTTGSGWVVWLGNGKVEVNTKNINKFAICVSP